MNGIECISLTAAISTILHFTLDCFGYYKNEEEEFKDIKKIDIIF